jgi:holo-[acyl-carrier protein] synthase
MIVGIGVDIVSIERIERLHLRYGERLAARLLGPAERRRLNSGRVPAAPYIAKRFAAKEAVSKALGTGFAEGLRWSEIEVLNDARGRPQVRLSGRAAALAEDLGVLQVHLSLADERRYAVAQAVLEAGSQSREA